MSKNSVFSKGDVVVYPSHGVGTLKNVAKETVAGFDLEVLVINFKRNNMVLRLPMSKAKNTGLRAVSSSADIDDILSKLKNKIRPTKGIWARRAQEYEMKINSGRLSLLSEVLRELHRKKDQSEQSYSERQIYQNALSRLASEVSVVKSIEFDEACEQLNTALRSSS